MNALIRGILSLAFFGSIIAVPGTAFGVMLPTNSYVSHIVGGVGPIRNATGLLITIAKMDRDAEILGIPGAPFLFDNLNVTPADDGRTFMRLPGDPGFDDFAALLTNGVADLFVVQIFSNNGSGGGVSVETEQSLLTATNGPPLPFVTDLQNFQIQSISLVVNNVIVNSMTDEVTIDAYLAVQVPEPSTMNLAGAAGVLLFIWRASVWRRLSRNRVK